ncbi:MAG TPA: DinB family protein [Chloroflexi bacterium]|nr:DinB family protein [Chloroflexota bacterium]
MISTQQLVDAFERNLKTVQMQTAGLTHADSVLQPPFRGNCLNWVMGHIIDNRNTILRNLGAEPIITEDQAKRYGYGSEPVCEDGDDIMRLETLLELMAESQKTLAAALDRIAPEELGKEVQSFAGPTTLGHYLFLLYYHETYHVGQTEFLRQLAGTNDKII